MKLANRLLACASLVQRGAVAADVGADHGYLAIHLVRTHVCPRMIVSDLREKPLAAARRNAAQAGVQDSMAFYRSDGLDSLPMDEIQTVICAGMGGDTISGILARCPEVCSPDIQLILQPQSSGNDLRAWLTTHGFSIRQEVLARDGAFLYAAMEARFGNASVLSPGAQYVSPQLLESGSPLLPDYFAMLEESLARTVESLRQARADVSRRRDYYETALHEIQEMRNCYDNRTDRP